MTSQKIWTKPSIEVSAVNLAQAHFRVGTPDGTQQHSRS